MFLVDGNSGSSSGRKTISTNVRNEKEGAFCNEIASRNFLYCVLGKCALIVSYVRKFGIFPGIGNIRTI